MQPSTPPTPHPTDPPMVAAELLETVARALAAALIPAPRQPEPPAVQEPDFLTAAQLAARLGVSRETVRRLAITGALPVFRAVERGHGEGVSAAGRVVRGHPAVWTVGA